MCCLVPKFYCLPFSLQIMHVCVSKGKILDQAFVTYTIMSRFITAMMDKDIKSIFRGDEGLVRIEGQNTDTFTFLSKE